MGLDSFNTGGSTTSRSTNSQTNTQQKQDDEDDEPFKVVNGDRGRQKVFPTEEDWEETVEFIEEEMNMTEGEVMNMSAGDRHEILHKAILQHEGDTPGGFRPTKECIVCGQDFVFPKNWNFTRIMGEASCNHHEIGEVMEAVSEVNQIQG